MFWGYFAKKEKGNIDQQVTSPLASLPNDVTNYLLISTVQELVIKHKEQQKNVENWDSVPTPS